MVELEKSELMYFKIFSLKSQFFFVAKIPFLKMIEFLYLLWHFFCMKTHHPFLLPHKNVWRENFKLKSCLLYVILWNCELILLLLSISFLCVHIRYDEKERHVKGCKRRRNGNGNWFLCASLAQSLYKHNFENGKKLHQKY